MLRGHVHGHGHVGHAHGLVHAHVRAPHRRAARLPRAQLACEIEPLVFAPGEMAPIGPLYIVNRGLAMYGGVIYSRGKYWGEDVILTTEELRLKYCALAMNFLEVRLRSGFTRCMRSACRCGGV